MKSTEHWDQYWLSSKSLNSFGEGTAADGYQGEVLVLWHQQFATLPSDGTLVDIGTGNGAIVVAAREFSNQQQHNFTLHGIDAANIKPQQVFASDTEMMTLLSSIRFHPACQAEQMPFADHSVDMLTSQFAFEYADRSRALQECLRVLKPGGRLVAIMHHSSSEVAKDSEVGLSVLADFLQHYPFFEQVRSLLRCLASQARLAPAQQNLAPCKQLNQQVLATARQIQQGLSADTMDWFNDVMSRVAKLIMNVQPNYLQSLAAIEQSLQAFYQRLADQQQASMSPAEASSFKQQLEQFDVDYSLEEIQIENQLFD